MADWAIERVVIGDGMVDESGLFWTEDQMYGSYKKRGGGGKF